MSARKNYLSYFMSYLPGLVLLVLSMVALHSSVRVMQAPEKLVPFYKKESHDISYLDEMYREFNSSLMLYLSEPSETHVKRVHVTFGIYTEAYLDKLKEADLSSSLIVSKEYSATIRGVKDEVMAVAKTMSDTENRQVDYILVAQEVRALHRKIERLWLIIYSKEQTEEIHNLMMTRGVWVYWSVILLGLSGFILVLLNSDKVRKLKAANDARQYASKLLENRQAAMEATQDGIGIVDANGNLTYMNKALMTLHAISPEELDQFIGQPWELLYNEDGQSDVRDNALSDLNEGGCWRGVSPVARQDGTIVHAELSLTRLLDGGMIGTARDITEKLAAEQEKEELQDQFYQAQKMEAIGRLAGGIAHDFNNILAAMNGYAEFLIEDLKDTTTQQTFAKNILLAGTQAKSLVDQMLAFSRRESSETKHLDLIVSLDESVSMLKAGFPKGIELKTNIQVDTALINGNATQLSQLIMNLCVNARDAMDDDKGVLDLGVYMAAADEYADFGFVKSTFPETGEAPVIRIEDSDSGRTCLFLSHIVHDQKYIVLSVRDTGCGMSRVVMEHIFEPFFTTKSVDKGTGLGLATVHGVVISHRGAMVIDSMIGEGTEFKLFFPLVEGAAPIETSAVNNAQEQEKVSAHIHLVEDQEEVRDVMLMMLQRLGYETTYTETGLEALEYLTAAGDDVDLVITDYNMPKMTGLEMITQVHQHFPDMPFIMLSGYSKKKLHDLMKEQSAIKAVLRKPVSRQMLEQKIATVLAAHEAETRGT